MIPAPDTVTAVLSSGGSFVMHARIESWLDGELLADDVPISGGKLTRDRSVAVPEMLELEVPAVVDGVSWDPTQDSGHALAWYGQRLKVSYGVELANGEVEYVTLGWFLITQASVDEDSVSVTAKGLLTLIEEARFVSPFQPKTSATMKSTIRAIVEPALTVLFDPSLTDRTIPTTITWDEDRLGALKELVSAWGAEMVVTNEGYLYVSAVADSSTVVWDLHDYNTEYYSDFGTLTARSIEGTREGAFNVVVASGQTSTGVVVRGTYADDSGGPMDRSGPFNPLPVPYKYESPLLTTVAQCTQAATTIYKRLRRTATRDIGITCVPNPLLETGDRVSVESLRFGYPYREGIIEKTSLGLVAGDSGMELIVRSVVS